MTNLIDNGHSALRDRARQVKNWQSGSMALRWSAVALDHRTRLPADHGLQASLDAQGGDRGAVERSVSCRTTQGRLNFASSAESVEGEYAMRPSFPRLFGLIR